MCVSTSSDSIMAGYDFKEDGCYKYWDGSPLGVFYNYGTYERRDSVITLHSEIRNAPLETHLIIRPYFPAANPSFNAKSVLIAHDKSGDAINDNNAYYIRELNSNN